MKISVILEALTGSFETDMKRASKEADKAFKQMQRDAKAAGAAIGASIAVGATAAAVAIKSAIDEMDDISKTAQKIGVTTEALSALQYAAELSDVSIGQLQGGLTKLARQQAEVARGTEKQAELFKAIGVEALNADGSLRDTGQVLADIADVFASMPDGAEKTALAFELLGKNGTALIPMLNGGAQGLRELTDEAARLGVVVSGDAARAAEEFNDNLTRMQAAMRGAAFEAAQQLLPVLNDLSGQVVEMANDPAFQRDLANAIETIGRAAISAVTGIVDMTNALGYLFDEARARAFQQFKSGDIVRMEEEAERLQKALEGGILDKRIKVFKDGKIFEVVSDEEIRRELTELQARIDKAYGEILLQPVNVTARRKTQPPPGRIFAPSSQNEENPYLAKPNPQVMLELERSLDYIDQLWTEREQANKDVAQLRMQSLTDEQRAIAELQASYIELQNAVKAGAITQEEAVKISADLAQRWAEDTKEKTAEMSEFAREAARNMQGAFAEFLFDPFSGSLKEMALDFVNVLRRMAAEALAAKIFDAIGGWAKGSAGTGGAAGFFGTLFSSFAGAKDSGGSIAAGSFALVGERRPEFVAGPATVIGGAQTASMLRPASKSNETKIRIISITDQQNAADYLSSDPGEQNILAIADKNRAFFKQLVAS